MTRPTVLDRQNLRAICEAAAQSTSPEIVRLAKILHRRATQCDSIELVGSETMRTTLDDPEDHPQQEQPIVLLTVGWVRRRIGPIGASRHPSHAEDQAILRGLEGLSDDHVLGILPPDQRSAEDSPHFSAHTWGVVDPSRITIDPSRIADGTVSDHPNASAPPATGVQTPHVMTDIGGGEYSGEYHEFFPEGDRLIVRYRDTGRLVANIPLSSAHFRY